jgi:hypothetical protein
MKIFLSWSGPRSRAVAETLNDWLRRVIQAVKPFYSPEIEKGAKWSSEVDDALEGTRFGIICLTPDNLTSPWIHYEAGALAKTKDALIWTFLHGLTPAEVPPPLGKFQHTVAEKEDVLLLLRTINGRLAEVGGEPLPDRLLEENFEMFWPTLEKGLRAAEAIPKDGRASGRKGASEKVRDEGAKLDEILELVRSQERRMTEFEERLAAVQPRLTPTENSALSREHPPTTLPLLAPMYRFILNIEGDPKAQKDFVSRLENDRIIMQAMMVSANGQPPVVHVYTPARYDFDYFASCAKKSGVKITGTSFEYPASPPSTL